ncbi:hypothetical protein J3458_003514 [Metarhizium acridum]|uniref:uncharacterized protein n=1 Tax=Metarhizium acridum TaxID=92637 RepID=UPI001C6B6C9A|nr:hypothetical protein J3458_003514 [Metarhizium acridum]
MRTYAAARFRSETANLARHLFHTVFTESIEELYQFFCFQSLSSFLISLRRRGKIHCRMFQIRQSGWAGTGWLMYEYFFAQEKVITLMTVFNGVFEPSYLQPRRAESLYTSMSWLWPFSQACVRIHREGGERYK